MSVSGRRLAVRDNIELGGVTGSFIFKFLKEAPLALLGDFVVVE